jgi:hypothetical protein
MRLAFILLLFVARSFAGETNSPSLFKLADVLPSGRCETEIMAIRFSDRANELMLKLQAAMTTNRDWFFEQVKKAKPGEPLEYDPKLGLTKDEYAEFLLESQNRHLASAGARMSCVFHTDGDILTLDNGDTNSPLGKIRLNTKTGELFASAGKIGMPTWGSGDDPKLPIGAYESCSWMYEKTDSNLYNVRIVKLDIYRLKPSGKILWRFDDSEMIDKKSKQQFEVLFQYSLNDSKADAASDATKPGLSDTNKTTSATGSIR